MNVSINEHTDNSDVASAIMTDEGFNADQSGSPLAMRGSNQAGGLRSEAVADFKHLNGYWNRIIVRDMSSRSTHVLPSLFIDNLE